MKYLFVLLTIRTIDSEYGSVYWKEISDTDKPEEVIEGMIKDNFSGEVYSDNGYTIHDTKESLVKQILTYTKG